MNIQELRQFLLTNPDKVERNRVLRKNVNFHREAPVLQQGVVKDIDSFEGQKKFIEEKYPGAIHYKDHEDKDRWIVQFEDGELGMYNLGTPNLTDVAAEAYAMAPEIAGAAVTALGTRGMGVIPANILMALGAEGADQLAKLAEGQLSDTPIDRGSAEDQLKQAGTDIALEATLGGLMEGAFRGLPGAWNYLVNQSVKDTAKDVGGVVASPITGPAKLGARATGVTPRGAFDMPTGMSFDTDIQSYIMNRAPAFTMGPDGQINFDKIHGEGPHKLISEDHPFGLWDQYDEVADALGAGYPTDAPTDLRAEFERVAGGGDRIDVTPDDTIDPRFQSPEEKKADLMSKLEADSAGDTKQITDPGISPKIQEAGGLKVQDRGDGKGSRTLKWRNEELIFNEDGWYRKYVGDAKHAPNMMDPEFSQSQREMAAIGYEKVGDGLAQATLRRNLREAGQDMSYTFNEKGEMIPAAPFWKDEKDVRNFVDMWQDNLGNYRILDASGLQEIKFNDLKNKWVNRYGNDQSYSVHRAIMNDLASPGASNILDETSDFDNKIAVGHLLSKAPNTFDNPIINPLDIDSANEIFDGSFQKIGNLNEDTGIYTWYERVDENNQDLDRYFDQVGINVRRDTFEPYYEYEDGEGHTWSFNKDRGEWETDIPDYEVVESLVEDGIDEADIEQEWIERHRGFMKEILNPQQTFEDPSTIPDGTYEEAKDFVFGVDFTGGFHDWKVKRIGVIKNSDVDPEYGGTKGQAPAPATGGKPAQGLQDLGFQEQGKGFRGEINGKVLNWTPEEGLMIRNSDIPESLKLTDVENEGAGWGDLEKYGTNKPITTQWEANSYLAKDGMTFDINTNKMRPLHPLEEVVIPENITKEYASFDADEGTYDLGLAYDVAHFYDEDRINDLFQLQSSRNEAGDLVSTITFPADEELGIPATNWEKVEGTNYWTDPVGGGRVPDEVFYSSLRGAERRQRGRDQGLALDSEEYENLQPREIYLDDKNGRFLETRMTEFYDGKPGLDPRTGEVAVGRYGDDPDIPELYKKSYLEPADEYQIGGLFDSDLKRTTSQQDVMRHIDNEAIIKRDLDLANKPQTPADDDLPPDGYLAGKDARPATSTGDPLEDIGMQKITMSSGDTYRYESPKGEIITFSKATGATIQDPNSPVGYRQAMQDEIDIALKDTGKTFDGATGAVRDVPDSEREKWSKTQKFEAIDEERGSAHQDDHYAIDKYEIIPSPETQVHLRQVSGIFKNKNGQWTIVDPETTHGNRNAHSATYDPNKDVWINHQDDEISSDNVNNLITRHIKADIDAMKTDGREIPAGLQEMETNVLGEGYKFDPKTGLIQRNFRKTYSTNWGPEINPEGNKVKWPINDIGDENAWRVHEWDDPEQFMADMEARGFADEGFVETGDLDLDDAINNAYEHLVKRQEAAKETADAIDAAPEGQIAGKDARLPEQRTMVVHKGTKFEKEVPLTERENALVDAGFQEAPDGKFYVEKDGKYLYYDPQYPRLRTKIADQQEHMDDIIAGGDGLREVSDNEVMAMTSDGQTYFNQETGQREPIPQRIFGKNVVVSRRLSDAPKVKWEAPISDADQKAIENVTGLGRDDDGVKYVTAAGKVFRPSSSPINNTWIDESDPTNILTDHAIKQHIQDEIYDAGGFENIPGLEKFNQHSLVPPFQSYNQQLQLGRHTGHIQTQEWASLNTRAGDVFLVDPDTGKFSKYGPGGVEKNIEPTFPELGKGSQIAGKDARLPAEETGVDPGFEAAGFQKAPDGKTWYATDNDGNRIYYNPETKEFRTPIEDQQERQDDLMGIIRDPDGNQHKKEPGDGMRGIGQHELTGMTSDGETYFNQETGKREPLTPTQKATSPGHVTDLEEDYDYPGTYFKEWIEDMPDDQTQRFNKMMQIDPFYPHNGQYTSKLKQGPNEYIFDKDAGAWFDINDGERIDDDVILDTLSANFGFNAEHYPEFTEFLDEDAFNRSFEVPGLIGAQYNPRTNTWSYSNTQFWMDNGKPAVDPIDGKPKILKGDDLVEVDAPFANLGKGTQIAGKDARFSPKDIKPGDTIDGTSTTQSAAWKALDDLPPVEGTPITVLRNDANAKDAVYTVLDPKSGDWRRIREIDIKVDRPNLFKRMGRVVRKKTDSQVKKDLIQKYIDKASKSKNPIDFTEYDNVIFNIHSPKKYRQVAQEFLDAVQADNLVGDMEGSLYQRGAFSAGQISGDRRLQRKEMKWGRRPNISPLADEKIAQSKQAIQDDFNAVLGELQAQGAPTPQDDLGVPTSEAFQRLQTGQPLYDQVQPDAVPHAFGIPQNIKDNIVASASKRYNKLEQQRQGIIEDAVSILNQPNQFANIDEFRDVADPALIQQLDPQTAPIVQDAISKLGDGDVVSFDQIMQARQGLWNAMQQDPEGLTTSGRTVAKLYNAINSNLENQLYQATAPGAPDTTNLFGSAAIDAVEKLRRFDSKHGREIKFTKNLQAGTDEVVLNTIMQGSEKSGRILESTLKSLDEGDRNAFRVNMLKNIGYDEQGNFAGPKFVQNWSKLHENARRALVPEATHREHLDKIAKVSSIANLDEYLKAYKDEGKHGWISAYLPFIIPAGGAAALANLGLGAGPFTTVLAGGIGWSAPKVAWRFMTSKPLAKWLADAAPAKPAFWDRSVGKRKRTKKEQFAAHIGQLAGIAANNHEDKEAIMEYLQLVNEAFGALEQGPPGTDHTFDLGDIASQPFQSDFAHDPSLYLGKGMEGVERGFADLLNIGR